jgi:hypothetical protein
VQRPYPRRAISSTRDASVPDTRVACYVQQCVFRTVRATLATTLLGRQSDVQEAIVSSLLIREARRRVRFEFGCLGAYRSAVLAKSREGRAVIKVALGIGLGNSRRRPGEASVCVRRFPGRYNRPDRSTGDRRAAFRIGSVVDGVTCAIRGSHRAAITVNSLAGAASSEQRCRRERDQEEQSRSHACGIPRRLSVGDGLDGSN